MAKQHPHVVIIGADFGGMYAARALDSASVRITVVDRHNHHLFQPNATRWRAPHSIRRTSPDLSANPPARGAYRGHPRRRGEGRHRRQGLRMTDDSRSRTTTASSPPALRHPTTARTRRLGAPRSRPQDSRRRARYSAARPPGPSKGPEREADVGRRHAHLTFVVVGGGPTGVEMAATIAELRADSTLARDFRHIDPREPTVLLLEGGPRILPSYPEQSSAIGKSKLRGLGVEVRENMLVSSIGRGCIEAAGWPSDGKPSCGPRACEVSTAEDAGHPARPHGRAIVEPECTIPGHPEVFVIGDAAQLPGPGARHAAWRGTYGDADGPLRRRAISETCRESRAPRSSTSTRASSPSSAAARRSRISWKLRFSGFVAWRIWAFVHIAFLIGFRNRMLVMLQWAWSYSQLRARGPPHHRHRAARRSPLPAA